MKSRTFTKVATAVAALLVSASLAFAAEPTVKVPDVKGAAKATTDNAKTGAKGTAANAKGAAKGAVADAKAGAASTKESAKGAATDAKTGAKGAAADAKASAKGAVADTKAGAAAAKNNAKGAAAGAVGATGAAAAAKVVDINTATEAELRTVPGIGEAYASKIIAGRPYANKAQLKSRNILPTPVYDKVKDLIVAKKK